MMRRDEHIRCKNRFLLKSLLGVLHEDMFSQKILIYVIEERDGILLKGIALLPHCIVQLGQ